MTSRSQRKYRRSLSVLALGVILGAWSLNRSARPHVASPYSEPQRWLKVNLHTHTTSSDGSLDYDEVVRLYAEAGYDAIAITDHDTYHPAQRKAGMLVIAGQECHVLGGQFAHAPHVLALGINAPIPQCSTPTGIVSEIRARGGLAVLAHPYGRPYEPFRATPGLLFEVFDGAMPAYAAAAEERWDECLRESGSPRVAIASDDMHLEGQAFQAWVCVNAPKTAQGILAALDRGDAYCSTGPEIRQIRVADDKVTIWGDPGEIHLVAASGTRKRRLSGSRGRVSFRVRPDDLYVRVELHTDTGTAWTNPFFSR